MDKKQPDDDTLKILRDTFNTDISQHLENSLGKMLDGFRQDLDAHPYFEKKDGTLKWRWVFSLKTPFFRLFLLPGTGMVCFAVLFTFFWGNDSPTWADLEKQFGIIPSCSISIYRKDAFQDEPMHAQLWIGPNGKIRMHSRDHIIFANGDRIRSFNLKLRTERTACCFAYSLLRVLTTMKDEPQTTLKSLIAAMAVETLSETTGIIISDETVSRDLLVFDAETHDTLWFVRIWVLRESKLPIRIVKWHRRHDRYEEILFTYSKEQPKTFFDSDLFAEKLQDRSISIYDLKYMFLKDPGGRAFMTPGS